MREVEACTVRLTALEEVGSPSASTEMGPGYSTRQAIAAYVPVKAPEPLSSLPQRRRHYRRSRQNPGARQGSSRCQLSTRIVGARQHPASRDLRSMQDCRPPRSGERPCSRKKLRSDLQPISLAREPRGQLDHCQGHPERAPKVICRHKCLASQHDP